VIILRARRPVSSHSTSLPHVVRERSQNDFDCGRRSSRAHSALTHIRWVLLQPLPPFALQTREQFLDRFLRLAHRS
jgi:hypothetical protein